MHCLQSCEIQGQKQRCPYCREILPETDEVMDQHLMKRVEANDPVAICQMGFKRYNKGDHAGAFEDWKKAAELGNADSHFKLSILYRKG